MNFRMDHNSYGCIMFVEGAGLLEGVERCIWIDININKQFSRVCIKLSNLLFGTNAGKKLSKP